MSCSCRTMCPTEMPPSLCTSRSEKKHILLNAMCQVVHQFSSLKINMAASVFTNNQWTHTHTYTHSQKVQRGGSPSCSLWHFQHFPTTHWLAAVGHVDHVGSWRGHGWGLPFSYFVSGNGVESPPSRVYPWSPSVPPNKSFPGSSWGYENAIENIENTIRKEMEQIYIYI